LAKRELTIELPKDRITLEHLRIEAKRIGPGLVNLSSGLC